MSAEPPSASAPVHATSGRRHERKMRTREALVDAARELGREHGIEHVTAEDIAERAGVSRRTFFNYFPTLEAVVAEGLRPPLEEIAAEVLRRPPHEDPLQAIAAALVDRPIPADILLGWARADTTRHGPRHPVQLRLWQHHEEWLVRVLGERLGDDDALRVSTLVATVMAIFEVVQDRFVAPGPVATDADALVDAFNTDLRRALEHARSGWREPPGS